MNFVLSEKEIDRLKTWLDKKDQVYAGAISGRFTYNFTPTGLGMIITVRDNIKKDEIDLTDLENW